MNTCSCGNPTDGNSTLCLRCGALQILDLKADSTDEDIRAAYLLLVKVWHPDRFQNDSDLKKAAEEKLKAINSAYCLLFATPGERDRRARPQETNSPPWNECPTQGMSSVPDEAQPFIETEPLTRPKRRSYWASFQGLTLLLRCSILLLTVAVGGVLLMAADSYLSTNLETARFYLGYRAAVMSELGALKSNIAGKVTEGLHGTNPGDAKSEIAPDQQAVQVTPTAERAVIHVTGKTQTRVVRVLPYITAGLTESEVLSVEGAPTSSSEDKMVYGRSELDFKDGELVGWKIDASSPLRVKLWPDAPVDRSLRSFTVGSSKNEVLVVQGTPNVFSADMFGYGRSRVYFKNNRVVSWDEEPGSVPLRSRE
jgi:hypothetical protein